MTAQNVEIVRRSTEAFAAGDVETALAALDPQIEWHATVGGIDEGRVAHGHQEVIEAFVDYFVQTAHPGTIQLDGDTASGRAYLHELIGLRDGGSHQNYAIYHDRYQRTGDGWKFTERVYEVRYLDTTPLTGSTPRADVPSTGNKTPAE